MDRVWVYSLIKKQDVILGWNDNFDPSKFTNNLWKINLLIMIISDRHNYIYSEGSVTKL